MILSPSFPNVLMSCATLKSEALELSSIQIHEIQLVTLSTTFSCPAVKQLYLTIYPFPPLLLNATND